MKDLREILYRIPKQLRILIDLLLAALLLFAWFVAIGGPRYGEEARFRRAEKANLVGPSELLDKMYVQGDWIPAFYYSRLLIGDDGDTILFYTSLNGKGSSSMDGVLIRREKTDGILLTTLPGESAEPVDGRTEPLILPLFLFVDDPAAVRAEVRLKLSESFDVTLRQVRGAENGDWSVRDRYFLFRLPVSPEIWNSVDSGEALRNLVRTNEPFSAAQQAFPATIRLYDGEDRLIETREYIIRSRAAEAAAEQNDERRESA